MLLIAGMGMGPGQVPASPEAGKTVWLQANPVPVRAEKAKDPEVRAAAALVMDVGSGTVLFEKSGYAPLPMASLTKIMTAILILEAHDVDEVVAIDQDYASTPGVKIWLQRGEKIRVGDLLIGLLVRSGGDAALALADYHSGSTAAFVDEMNKKAAVLGLKNTRFRNPIGLDEEGHFASAYDLVLLGKYAMRQPVFQAIVRMPTAEIFSVDGRIRHAFENTNKLLGTYLNVIGIKTGTTDEAGASVINLARGTEGREVIAIVMNSPDRFTENQRLMEWAFTNYSW